MNHLIAEQIASLVNNFSPITVTVSPDQVTEYLYEGDEENVAACVKIKRMSWYQWEISHLVVHPAYRRSGLGQTMVERACEQAKKLGCRVIQCTIRESGDYSRMIGERLGFTKGVRFKGITDHVIQVWQKTL